MVLIYITEILTTIHSRITGELINTALVLRLLTKTIWFELILARELVASMTALAIILLRADDVCIYHP